MHSFLLYTFRFLQYYIALTMVLGIIGLVFKRARFLARVLSFYFLIVGAASYGVVASALLRVIGKASIAQWAVARAFYNMTAPVLSYSIEVEGEEILETTRPAVFIANHQSEFDLALLGRLFPKHCSVTAKRSLQYIPFLGWFMTLSKTVFIDRANRKSAISAFDTAAADMQSMKQSVWIFPEGTRSYSTKPVLLPFKTGAFHLARQAKVPIVPIVVSNYAHVFNHKEKTFEAGNIKVKVLPPISIEGIEAEQVRDFATKVYDQMLKVLMEISPNGEKTD